MRPRCDPIATVDHSNATTTRLYEYVDEPTLQRAVEAIPAINLDGGRTAEDVQ
jgi:hypothetical protein